MPPEAVGFSNLVCEKRFSNSLAIHIVFIFLCRLMEFTLKAM